MNYDDGDVEYERLLTMVKTDGEVADALAAMSLCALKFGLTDVARKHLTDGCEIHTYNTHVQTCYVTGLL